MSSFFQFFLLGLGVGSIYALVALGLVLVYRGSGVVNFSQGALALSGAAFFFETKDSVPLVVAIVIATLGCAVIGALIQLLIMGPLRRSSPLARLIATLGLLALGLELWDRRYPRNIDPDQFLPDDGIGIFGTVVPESRLYLFGIALVLGFGLWTLYRWTRFGLATTAVAENENVAAALGWSPNLIATANWAVGAGLAGLAGSLLFGLLGINPVSHVLLVIPALAAALLGGFRSFPLTVAGGLALGVMDSLALRYIDGRGATQGLQQAIPFLLIILLLVVRGRALPLRSYAADRLPLLGTGRVRPPMIILGAAVFIASVFVYGPGWANALYVASYYGLVILSLVVLTGFAGQLSLAQFAVAGVGAMFAGRLAADLWGLPTWLAIIVGIAFTVPVGLLISLPALRIRGVNLAIITLALAVVIDAMFLTNARYSRDGFVPAVIPNPSFFGIELTRSVHPERFAVFAIVMFLLASLVVANIRRGGVGRRMIAVRGNEQAAASLGISVTSVKAFAFAVASGLAALGGSVVVFSNASFVPETNFPRLRNIDIVLFAVIGGIGHVAGAAIGGLAALGSGFERIVAQLIDPRGWWQLVAAVGLLLIVITRPDGAGENIAREWREAGDRRYKAFFVIGAIWFAVSLYNVHTVWNEAGIRGTSINEGQISRILLIIALVLCVVGFLRVGTALTMWIGAALAAISVAVILLTTSVATEELEFDGTWKWTVAGVTYAFVFAIYIALHTFVKRTDRPPANPLDGVTITPTKVPPRTLQLRGVTVQFGTVVALSNADITVKPGTVHGLIGPNGAGKTTLIEATTGFVQSEGSIEVDGQDVTGMSATQRARLGIARSFQSLELFEDMTVYDNLRTAADSSNLLGWLRDLVWPTDQGLSTSALAAISEFDLADVLHMKPDELPYAERRTVAIARALAAEPSIILLDEPAAGLDSASTSELEVLIRRLAEDWGMAVLLIEHDVGLVMRVCDEITAIDFGVRIAHGTPDEVGSDPAVIAAYLGTSDEDEEEVVST